MSCKHCGRSQKIHLTQPTAGQCWTLYCCFCQESDAVGAYDHSFRQPMLAALHARPARQFYSAASAYTRGPMSMPPTTLHERRAVNKEIR